MGSVTVRGIGKAYRRYPNRWTRIASWIFPDSDYGVSIKWVLKDISFHIEAGQSVGIVGINGAGKSTLLKIITGTTMPTVGQLEVNGRIAAMLELGMGFHPDFTGRQNVVMAGQLLGMTVEELTAAMPEIEAFAEIGSYIDEPVRTYSSGMQMRLAFSVASARRPDVLVVDEAFSVGDAYFQHKSFDRIRRFRDAGTTLLLVSHDPTAIKSICDRAILLDGGRLAKDGAPDEVLDFYNALLADRENRNVAQSPRADGRIETRSGTGEARVTNVRLINDAGDPIEVLNAGASVTLEIVVETVEAVSRLVLGYMVRDRLGQAMYGTNTDHKQCVQHDLAAGERLVFRFLFAANLGPGTYSVSTSVSSTETHLVNNYEWRDLALVFTVVNLSRPYFVGCNLLDPLVEVTR